MSHLSQAYLLVVQNDHVICVPIILDFSLSPCLTVAYILLACFQAFPVLQLWFDELSVLTDIMQRPSSSGVISHKVWLLSVVNHYR